MEHNRACFYLSDQKAVLITLDGRLVIESTNPSPASRSTERVILDSLESLRLARMIEHWESFGNFLGWEMSIPWKLSINSTESTAIWLCHETIWGKV